MICGDHGHVTKGGTPCGQQIAETATACIWHSHSAEERSEMMRQASLMGQERHRKILPKNAPKPDFSSREAIVAWSQDKAHRVLTGQLDRYLSAEARGWASVALAAKAAEAQERLLEALVKLEHGGAAVAILTRLQEALEGGSRRPVPGRRLAVVAAPPVGAIEAEA